MEQVPKISVIVPVYNVEKYLPRCINSIIAQTFTDFELILINDGSKDESLSICKSYSKNYDNIILLSQENSGVSVARNKGIEIAKGEYCCFIDSDDYLEPDYLSSMLEAINKYSSDLVCCGCWREISNNKYEWIKVPSKDYIYNQREAIIKLFSQDSFCGWPWNKLYKTQIIRDNKLVFPEDIHFCEDEIFVLNYIIHCNHVVYLSRILYHYTVNNTSVNLNMITQKEFNYNFLERLKADEICHKILSSFNDSEILNTHNARQFVSNRIVLQKFLACYSNDKITLRKIQKNLLKYYPYYKTSPHYHLSKWNSYKIYFEILYPHLVYRLNQIKKSIKKILK